MASALIPGVDVNGFWTAIFGSLIISTVSFGVTMLISEKGDIHTIEMRHRGGNRWE
jgi:putative membrane protein